MKDSEDHAKTKKISIYRHGIKSMWIFIIASIYSGCTFGYYLFTDPEPVKWKNLLITFLPMLITVGCIFVNDHLFKNKYCELYDSKKSQ